MNHLLSLVLTSLQYKDAVFLQNPPALVNILVDILQETAWSMNVLSVVVKIASTLLLGLRVHLSQEMASKLIRKVSIIH